MFSSMLKMLREPGDNDDDMSFHQIASKSWTVQKAVEDAEIFIREKKYECWLTFVVHNRKGIPSDEIKDMTIGPVADDNVYQSIRLFETGAYDMEYTVKRLKTELLQDQWVFHTNGAAAFLRFAASERIIKE